MHNKSGTSNKVVKQIEKDFKRRKESEAHKNCVEGFNFKSNNKDNLVLPFLRYYNAMLRLDQKYSKRRETLKGSFCINYWEII